MRIPRNAAVAALCLVSAFIGALSAQLLPRADAQVLSPSTAAAVSAALPAQASYGSGGAYTVVPIMDSGAGYSWMAYALAVSPEGKVSIINTHPKKTDELGTIVKQFNIK